jgi:hypothetical protein
LTSPRRRPDRPIESVVLKITFRANREETARIREAVPSAVVHGGVCEVRISAEQPAEVAEKARVLLERLRAAA